MLLYAGHQFALVARQQDGSTLRDQLESVARQTGEIPKELAALTASALPEGMEHVWLMFLQLHGARGGNGFGANPISFSEIAAWSAMTGQQATPYEISAVRALDNMWMAEQAKEASRKA